MLLKREKTSPPAVGISSDADKQLVRSLWSADPKYGEADDLRMKLKADLRALDAEETELHGRWAGKRTTEENISSRVAALLGDQVAQDAVPMDGITARLHRIAEEKRDLRIAISTLDERMNKLRFAASKVICDEVRPHYVEAVRNLAEALKAARLANSALETITSSLNSQQVAWTAYLPPHQAHRVFTHDGGPIAHWLYEVSASGILKDTK